MVEIKGFIRTSLVDWDGKISAVIFLPNCNFRCPMCHNHELVLNPSIYPNTDIMDIEKHLITNSDFIDGIVITGGEPTIHEDLDQLLKRFKDKGFSVKLDTNGSLPDRIQNLIQNDMIDYVAMDIKAPLEDGKYACASGIQVNISRIRESIRYVMESGIDYEFRTTVVPTLHNEEDIVSIAKEIEGARRYVLQQFEPRNTLDKKFREIKPYSASYLKQMAEECKRFVREVKVRA